MWSTRWARGGRRVTERNEGSEISGHLIGLISDTHGLLRPDVHDVFTGVELILHAGDVGGDEILDELGLIAPVMAVYGNTDPVDHPRLSAGIRRQIDGVSIHVSHGHEVGSPNPARLLARYEEQVLVFGHTHKPIVTRSESRLVVNPGAAGPRRFDLAPSVGLLRIRSGVPDVEIVPLGY
ncbi:MAG TPA: metallophosphoesterase family protein [Gemmatimonadaceae bacterium]|nr:metallophosphoesterase family protein [Gemmatimonadaceae bacterium]